MARIAFTISSVPATTTTHGFSALSVASGSSLGSMATRISKVWREQTIADDPRHESNVRGTIAFAFAVPNGRTTQSFINLRDNSATHDGEPFVPFGRVVEGMDVADALYADYGESSGSGIRARKQSPLFDEGNPYLDRNFPRLDSIRIAVILSQSKRQSKLHFAPGSDCCSSPPGGPSRRRRGCECRARPIVSAGMTIAFPSAPA